MWRWARRQLQREWRQQLLILALVAFATGGAAFFATMIFYSNQPASEFTGSATQRLTVTEGESSLADTLLLVDEALGPIEAIGVRDVRRDQSSIDFELSDPPAASIFGAEPTRLVRGRTPTADGEIAISPGLSAQLNVDIGGQLPVDGVGYMVVGLVEDPANLGTPIGIVAPGTLDNPIRYIVLSEASEQAAFALQLTTPGIRAEPLGLGDDAQLVAVTAVVALAAVGMIEVALMCSAGFAVLGQRRLRQLGILSAVGATSRQLRGALRANGLFVGLAGGTVGVVVGFSASLAARPTLENLIGWRIPAWSVPWVAVIPLITLAGLAGLAAAWWPARSLARLPVVDALASRRRPTTSSPARWALGGVVGFVVGAAVLSVGVSEASGVLAVAGLVVAVVSLLFVTPGMVALAAKLAPRLSLAPRLALRAISRNAARSSATLAALVVAIGVPAAVVLTSSAADANLESGPPNLPNNWIAIWPEGSRYGDVPTSFKPDNYADDIYAVTAAIPGAQATPIFLLEAPADPTLRRVGATMVNTIRAARILSENGNGEASYVDAAVWVATPELLQVIGADSALSDDVPLFSTVEGETFLTPFEFDFNSDGRAGSPGGGFEPGVLDTIAYRDIGQYWMTPTQAEAQQGEPFIAGWLITKPTPFTTQELGFAYQNTDPALVVDAQRPNQTSDVVRRNTLVIGTATALAILAIAVTLLRVESGSEDRTLTALGADRRTRKRIAATTTGFLGISAAALALPAGYLALIAITSDSGANYPIVFPAWSIACLAIGIPIIGSLGAYLLTSTQEGKHP